MRANMFLILSINRGVGIKCIGHQNNGQARVERFDLRGQSLEGAELAVLLVVSALFVVFYPGTGQADAKIFGGYQFGFQNGL